MKLEALGVQLDSQRKTEPVPGLHLAGLTGLGSLVII